MRRLLLLLTAAALVASFAPAAVAADDEAVLLRYKFEADTEMVQELKGSGTIPMTIDLPEQAGGPKTIETMMRMEMDLVQKCDRVEEDGSGHIIATIPYMLTESTTKADGQTQFAVMSFEDGELVLTVNGETVDDPNTAKMMASLGQGYKMTMKPNGETKMDEESTEQISGLLKASGLGGIDFTKLNSLTSRLPEDPVKPGETWKHEAKVPAGETGEIAAVTETKYVGIEELEGVRCARLEGKSTLATGGEMPSADATGTPFQMTVDKMSMDVQFVIYFDLAAGQAAKTIMDVTQSMDLHIVAPGGPNGTQLEMTGTLDDGQMHIEVVRK